MATNISHLTLSLIFQKGNEMIKLNVGLLGIAAIALMTLTFSIVFINSANAESMTKSKYQALEKNLNVEYKAAKVRCKSLYDDAKEICDAKAEGTRDISKAELEANFKPTIQNRYDANVTRADANYAIATEQCESLKDVGEDVCEKTAKVTHERGMASARAQRNNEKSDAIKKDKTAQLDDFNDETNQFVIFKISNIYNVRA